MSHVLGFAMFDIDCIVCETVSQLFTGVVTTGME